MTPPSKTLRLRMIHGAFGLATAAAVGVGVLALSGGAVEAQRVSLATNELAEEISFSADDAIAVLEQFEVTGSVADEQMFAWHRAQTARYVAKQLGYDEFAMIDAWSRASLEHQRAVLGALSQVGVPYRSNTSIEDGGFDCSGLITFAWSGAGHQLTRQSGSQISQAEPRTDDTAMAGDLIHYPGHIMMYLGVDDAIVHSVQTGRTVEVDTLSQRHRDRVRWGDPTT